ncbi:hypothetical protein Ddye_014702 [Dipteronia dyeriana]|uniref:DUF4283 domain-containing protein n=1 Tax=Dipteronia dyeriana TaxID=168575 RepID=A0AAD9X8U7_9ROSI|nr:hypothetical protein Ddye_014702 [Dipteronia dyeriana]
MGRWSDSNVPKCILVWVNCFGFPLRCWSEIFFNKVGRLLGEPVLLVEETKTGRRIDRGRFLVLIQHGHVCPRKIRVEEGMGSFEVMIEEEGTPLDYGWVEKFLELKLKTIQVSSNFLEMNAFGG